CCRIEPSRTFCVHLPEACEMKTRECPVCGLRNVALVSFGPAGLAYWLRCDDCGTEYRVSSHRTRSRPSAYAILGWGIFVFLLCVVIAIIAMDFLGPTPVPYHRYALTVSDHVSQMV